MKPLEVHNLDGSKLVCVLDERGVMITQIMSDQIYSPYLSLNKRETAALREWLNDLEKEHAG